MPLVLFCGIPCSGKTTRAKALLKFLQDHGKTVVLINEETLYIRKNEGYSNSKEEKKTRSLILAEAERWISDDVVVIVDSLNYIKGFRYEVFCRSRSQKTTNCVVYCEASKDVVQSRNNSRTTTEERWNPLLLDDLNARFEVPNPRNRWDRPLLTVREQEEIPFQDIFTALFEYSEAPPKNSATEFNKIELPNFLFEMDQITQSIVSDVLESSNAGNLGEIPVSNSTMKVSGGILFFFVFLNRLCFPLYLL